MHQNEPTIIYVKYDDIVFKYFLHYQLSVKLFEPYIVNACEYHSELSIDLSDINAHFKKYNQLHHPCESETWLLLEKTALELFAYNATIFHAAAFIWNQKAWLFSAPSGTGKTTQLMNWKREYGDFVQTINGDKPILHVTTNKQIIVNGSPWRGKEHFGSNVSAHLGGIVFLEQGNTDQIERMDANSSILHLFSAIWTRPETISQIESLSFIIDSIVKSCPVWKLVNRGDLNSVYITRDCFLKTLEAEHEI